MGSIYLEMYACMPYLILLLLLLYTSQKPGKMHIMLAFPLIYPEGSDKQRGEVCIHHVTWQPSTPTPEPEALILMRSGFAVQRIPRTEGRTRTCWKPQGSPKSFLGRVFTIKTMIAKILSKGHKNGQQRSLEGSGKQRQSLDKQESVTHSQLSAHFRSVLRPLWELQS